MTCWLCHGGFETNAGGHMCKNGPCQSCVEVGKVEMEIEQTMAILQRLLANRRDLLSEQNRVHDPMHRLPVELKNYIFKLLLPSHDEWGGNATVMPSYLASVCRAWRDTALSNPFLWSTLSVSLTRPTPDPSIFVHKWIQRSRTLPLTFHFQVVKGMNITHSRKVLVDFMTQCSNRLQSLSFNIACPDLCNLPWHRLTRLRILLPTRPRDDDQISFNATASPEKIELCFVSLKSLQISWNRLSSAKLEFIDWEDIALLFQHASQMTDCHISFTDPFESLLVPPIIHHRLKTLSLHDSLIAPALLGSLTLPCLQELHTSEMDLLTHLPAFMQRSSCPLTRLKLSYGSESEFDLDRLQPLPGVADLVVNDIGYWGQDALIKKLLFEEYFPDLRQLTLGLQPFLLLWDMGVIPLYLDLKRPLSDGPSEGRLDKFVVVVNPGETLKFKKMWNSDVGEQVKALGISLRKDGFEFS